MSDLISSYQGYLQRRDFYKERGYDLEAEREQIINKAEPLGERILEVGSGKGYFTMILAKKAPRLTSIDISEAEQTFARENICALGLAHKVDFQIADARYLPFADGAFDNIFCINSFHHIQDTVCVLAELMRVCATQGKITISDFTEKGFGMIGQMHQSEGREHHFYSVDWQDLSAQLEKENFRVVSFKSVYQRSLLARRLDESGLC